MAKFIALPFQLNFSRGLPECKGASSGVAIGDLDRSPTPLGPGSCKETIGAFLFLEGSCRGPRIHRDAGEKKCPDFFWAILMGIPKVFGMVSFFSPG